MQPLLVKLLDPRYILWLLCPDHAVQPLNMLKKLLAGCVRSLELASTIQATCGRVGWARAWYGEGAGMSGVRTPLLPLLPCRMLPAALVPMQSVQSGPAVATCGAGHDLHVMVWAAPSLELLYQVLDIAEAISHGEVQ